MISPLFFPTAGRRRTARASSSRESLRLTARPERPPRDLRTDALRASQHHRATRRGEHAGDGSAEIREAPFPGRIRRGDCRHTRGVAPWNSRRSSPMRASTQSPPPSNSSPPGSPTPTRAKPTGAPSRFCAWATGGGLTLSGLSSVHVASYLDRLGKDEERGGDGMSVPTVKQHLAALLHWLDWLTQRGVLKFNPTAAVRGPRHSQNEGKTPVLERAEVKALFAAFDTELAEIQVADEEAAAKAPPSSPALAARRSANSNGETSEGSSPSAIRPCSR